MCRLVFAISLLLYFMFGLAKASNHDGFGSVYDPFSGFESMMKSIDKLLGDYLEKEAQPESESEKEAEIITIGESNDDSPEIIIFYYNEQGEYTFYKL